MAFSAATDNERERWNDKYRLAPDQWIDPDPFLLRAFEQFIQPRFRDGGKALDIAGGAGRHAIWLAQQGWEVTLIDISETGVELARQRAGSLASSIRFVLDDLTGPWSSQTRSEEFDVVVGFFYLERTIFAEIVKMLKPGGLLVYKTLTLEQLKLPGGPRDPAHLLASGELRRLADGLQVLHYAEEIGRKATAELVAMKPRSTDAMK
jgi:tellurite methyltransferase